MSVKVSRTQRKIVPVEIHGELKLGAILAPRPPKILNLQKICHVTHQSKEFLISNKEM